mmetsp:Transcript_102413/g.298638  ORF Transcript_102413/g.298638 Transcript_102413/m.298638 type:complete len:201 (+) Transcript_102413:697-1299(+)
MSTSSIPARVAPASPPTSSGRRPAPPGLHSLNSMAQQWRRRAAAPPQPPRSPWAPHNQAAASRAPERRRGGSRKTAVAPRALPVTGPVLLALLGCHPGALKPRNRARGRLQRCMCHATGHLHQAARAARLPRGSPRRACPRRAPGLAHNVHVRLRRWGAAARAYPQQARTRAPEARGAARAGAAPPAGSRVPCLTRGAAW